MDHGACQASTNSLVPRWWCQTCLPRRLQPHALVSRHTIRSVFPQSSHLPSSTVQPVWLHQHPLYSVALTNTLVHKASKTHIPRHDSLSYPPTYVLTLVHTLTHVAHTRHSYTNMDIHILLYRHAQYSHMHACTFSYMFPQGFETVCASSHTNASLHTHTYTHHTTPQTHNGLRTDCHRYPFHQLA